METDVNRRIHHANLPPIHTTVTTPNRQFKDGIVLIYSFLTFTELLTAGRVAHQWYQIIRDITSSVVTSGERAPLMRYTYQPDLSTLARYQQFSALLQSPARVLITSIPPSTFGARIVDLQQITNGLPQLSELALDVCIPQRGLSPHESLILTHETLVEFPSHLISLTIHMTYSAIHGGVNVTYPHKSFFQHLFSTICEKVTQLEKLVWLIPYTESEVDVTCLLNLSHLTYLEDSFSHEKRDVISMLTVKHWKLPYRMAPHGIRFDWHVFHRESTLMKNLEEWTIMNAAFTPDDYRSLATNASNLTRLEFHPQSQTNFEGFRHLADSNVQHIKLYSIRSPCTELIHLVKLRSLTFARVSILEVDSWLNLFATLTCLEVIDFAWSIIPTQLVAVLPHKTTLRHIALSQTWVKGLVDCQRLQELSLVDITGGYSCDQLKEDLRLICNSSANSLRRVEVRNWAVTTPGTGQSVKSTFILDSSKSMAQPSHPSNDSLPGPGVETVANASPLKDLTRYGIEPHPGPTHDPSNTLRANTSISRVNESTSTSSSVNQVTRMEIAKTFRLITISTSPATMFKDGLFMIYSFLTLKEFIRATSTCQHWYQPLLNQLDHPLTKLSSLLHYTYEVDCATSEGFAEFLAVLHSSTARLFVSCIGPQSHIGGLPPSICDLESITNSLPHLTALSLNTCIPLDLDELSPKMGIHLPCNLISLSIEFNKPLFGRVYSPTPVYLQLLLNFICEQAPLLQRLVWAIQNGVTQPAESDLSGLLKLSHLTDLTCPLRASDMDVLVKLHLKRWKMLHLMYGIFLDWRRFHSTTAVMIHLEDWTLDANALEENDYLQLAHNAPGLNTLTLQSFLKGPIRDLAHAMNLHHLRVDGYRAITNLPIDELTCLVKLRSLTCRFFRPVGGPHWSRLLKALHRLERLDIGHSDDFPEEVLIECPKSTTLRAMDLTSSLLTFLPLCQRLQELSLIEVTIEKDVRDGLKAICLSKTNSIRRIEAVGLRRKDRGGGFVTESFIFDSLDPPIIVENVSVPYASPSKDLTRHGIEPHPGPIGATIDVERVNGTVGSAATLENTTVEYSSPISSDTNSSPGVFKDGLLTIYSFLSLKEFIRASGVCRHWSQPIRSVIASDKSLPPPLLRYSYEVDPSSEDCHQELLAILKSSARFFITSLLSRRTYDFYLLGDRSKHELIALRIVELPRITDGLPSLTHCNLDPAIHYEQLQALPTTILSQETQFQFPLHLTSLTIRPFVLAPSQSYQHIFNAICSQLLQLQKFVCHIQPHGQEPTLDVSGLLKLPYLTHLEGPFDDRYPKQASNLVLVQLSLQRCVMLVPNKSEFDWSLFHASTPLMTHLRDWTMTQVEFTKDDYIHLVASAQTLTCLDLHYQYRGERNLDGLQYLSRMNNLRQLQLTYVYDPANELKYLVGLQTLTLTRVFTIDVRSWLNLFKALTRLEEIEFIACDVPHGIISACPARTTLRDPRRVSLDVLLTDHLFKCTRLRELTFLMDYPPQVAPFQTKMRAICDSPFTSLRRIEITWLKREKDHNFHRTQSFIIDGSKTTTADPIPLELVDTTATV